MAEGDFATGTALNIRQDYTADDLRQLARKSRDADWSSRLLALSVIYEGGSRSHAASIGGVSLQIIRDWVERFNQHGPVGLKTGNAKGREPLLNDKQRETLVEAVEKGPVPYLDGVVRWRLVDLVHWLWQEPSHLGEAIRRSQLRIDARKWMAGKLKPKKYGDKLDVDHGGAVRFDRIETVIIDPKHSRPAG